MNYCTEFAVLQSALQLVEKQNLLSDKDERIEPVCVVKLAVQEIIEGLEEDHEPEEQAIPTYANIKDKLHRGKYMRVVWSRKIHSVLLYKLLTSYHEKLSEKCAVDTVQEASDNFQDEWVEPERIDSRDILSHALPPVSHSLYFSLVKECCWHEFLTEILCHLREDLTCELIRDGLSFIQQRDTYSVCDLKLGFCFLEYLMTHLISDDESVHGALNHLSEVLTRCSCVIDNLSENSVQHDNTDVLTNGFHQTSLLLCLCNKEENVQNLQKWFQGNAIGVKSGFSGTNFNFRAHFGKFMKNNLSKCFLDLNSKVINYLKENLSLNSLITLSIKLMSLGGQSLCCSLLDSLSSGSESRFVYICKTVILMYPDNRNAKPVLNKVRVLCESRNLCRQVIQSLLGACDLSIKDTSETIHSHLSSMLESVNVDDEIFPDISVAAAIWRIQERQPDFQDFLSKIVRSPIASLWSCDKLLSVLQSRLQLISKEDTMLHLYELVWKLNSKLTETQSEKLTKLVLDGFGLLDVSTRGQHVYHVYRTYRQWPKHNPVTSLSLNQIFNKLTSGIVGKVQLDIQKAVLQDADLVVSQLLERTVGGSHQADIVCSILQTLRELCGCRTDSNRSMLCCRLAKFLTTHFLNQKEQDTIIRLLQNLIKPITDKEAVLDPEELYLSVVVPHLSPQGQLNTKLTVRFALDLGIALLAEMLQQGKPDIDLTLSLVSAAELLENCCVLWNNDNDSVILKQRLMSFLYQLNQFEEGKRILCVDWVLKAITDYDCTVRLTTLQVCLTTEEFHGVCDTLCVDLLQSKHDLDYLNLMRLVAVSETFSQMIGSYCHTGLILHYQSLLLVLLQVAPHLIPEEWIRLFKFLRDIVKSGHLFVSVKMSGSVPMINLKEVSEFLSISQLLGDLLRLLSHTQGQFHPPAIEHCIRSAMAVYKNVVLSETSTMTPHCCMFLLTQVFSHITLTTGQFSVEMLDSVNILLLDIVCQVEELSKITMDAQCRDQMARIEKASYSICSSDTREMVQKKIFSVLH